MPRCLAQSFLKHFEGSGRGSSTRAGARVLPGREGECGDLTGELVSGSRPQVVVDAVFWWCAVRNPSDRKSRAA